MRSRFIPLAAIAAAAIPAPLCATVYMTVQQVQAAWFPNQALIPDDRTLSPEQMAAIRAHSGVHVLSRTVRSWHAPHGGRLFVDRVLGKHEFITLALAVNADGTVRGLEILDYRESYGGQVRDPAWRHQFVGKRDGAPFELDKDIRNNSGGTLSARHVTEGVKRLLATNSIVFGAG